MDPFLSVVASAFPGRAGILYYKGQAKPEGCYPNRPAGGTRRGPGNHTTAVEKACSLHITCTVGHPRPSSFSMKKKFNLDLRKRFPSPAASPLLRRAFPLMVGGSIPLSELGGHSFQPYSNSNRGGCFEHRLKHDLKVLATPCVQYKIRKAARMTKRGSLSCVALKKEEDLRENTLLLGFFLLRPPPPGPR